MVITLIGLTILVICIGTIKNCCRRSAFKMKDDTLSRDSEK